MADVEQGNRPLSPHLQIYKWPINMGMSIFHRVTGVAIGVVIAFVALWFFALAWSPEAFAKANWLMTSWLGWLVLFGGAVSLWFHFVNGLRHLVWDTGSSFGQKRVRRTALIGLVFMVILTLVTIWVAVAV
ncbi:succinate dehydrogenase, cytochrome b556 subunit [Sinisalibacter aestuarii]|uniref:Succinate dehydrogenase cytochrome b556 subunit n=1 Tax=Sinisalibacter aestuarii TaxID=2949426 RepID=A0ABQ5LMB6_9RHOB|nr:succinate dehydrogenase, cytochrome b556 subunit [Sinisalibacter aestuarii]GKY86161.1 succinate dehydrogenase cytochrome b556 subunit [Sinisalibacter aestuarii]